MDNLTHSLVGLTVSKAGLEKLSPATSIVCILAANAPDIDLIFGVFGDRWTLLQYHREFTHSIVGTSALALIIPSLFCVADLILSSWRRQARTFRFRGLLLASLIASATHPLMDWTNNYGVRPLLPWSDRWFYGDLVFIVDPFLWLILGAAAFLLTSRSRLQLSLWSLLGVLLSLLILYAGVLRGALDHAALVMTLWIAALTTLFVLRRYGSWQRRSEIIAIACLALILVYWTALGVIHARAVAEARTVATNLAASSGEQVLRLAAMPTLANPTHWQCIVESDRSLYRFEIFLLEGTGGVHKPVRFVKPDTRDEQIIALAAQDRRAKILLGFARFPIARLRDHDCLTETFVQFADLRYTEPGKPRGNFSLELPIACPAKR